MNNDIFELTQLENNTMTQNDSLSRVANRNYIVGSIDDLGRFSFSSEPKFHANEADASREARRLALANPVKAYVYVELSGAYVVGGLTAY